MLVLSRKIGESIIVADNVTITILACKGNSTRIGITAPREISIQREEILLKNKQSGSESPVQSDPEV